MRLQLASKYPEALQRHGEALELCRNSEKALNRVLGQIAFIARWDHGQCEEARKLFHLVPASRRIDYLRLLVALAYSCSSREQLKVHLGTLVDVEIRTLAVEPQQAALRQFVLEYEEAHLFFWARELPAHLEHLRLATRELCRDETFPLAIRTLEQESEREETPVAGTLGFWTVQPSESLDGETRSCLAKVADAIRTVINHYPRNTQSQWKAWLDWYDTSLEIHLDRGAARSPRSGVSRNGPGKAE